MNIVVSPYLAAFLQQHSYTFRLIPNSIDIENYPFVVRSEIKPRILWVRAFHATYHPDMAIRLMQAVCKKYPDAMLTMVGPEKDGSLQRCKDLALELNVADNISFTGKLSKDQWISLSSQHDIFINTTNFDNLPVSLIEAMALGLPIISTNVGGLKFLIDDGNDGILVAPGDVNAMYNGVSSLINNPAHAVDMALKARKKAETYDWQLVRHHWNKLLCSTQVV